MTDRAGAGLQVVSVQPNGPAAQARIQPGDRLLAVDGQPVTNGGELIRKIQLSKPGAKFKFQIDREGLQGALWLVPVQQRGGLQDRVVRGPAALAPTHEPAALGITMYEGAYTGVRVLTVAQSSPAERAGLLVGDRIISINGEAVTDSRDVTALVALSRPGATIRIEIDREGLRGIVSPVLSSRAAVFRPAIPAAEFRTRAVQPATPYFSRSPGDINDQRSYGG